MPLKRRKTVLADGLSGCCGPSGATRTPGLLLPKQARYQLRNTRICNFCNPFQKIAKLLYLTAGGFSREFLRVFPEYGII